MHPREVSSVAGIYGLSPLHQATQLSLYGAKAANLARLINLGIPVPAGFVIDDGMFREHLRAAKLTDWIEDVVARLDYNDPTQVQEASARIRERVQASSMQRHLFDAVERNCNSLSGQGAYIVRSSAIGEDSGEFSFAGQLDSIGDVHTPTQLEAAILRCWASYWSARTLSYQHGTRASLAGLAVIVQRQVSAVISGVLFTRPPVGEWPQADGMIAEYCYGPGAALVSGEINPGRFVVFRDIQDWRKLCDPEQDTNSAAFGLDQNWIGQLRDCATQIEQSFGTPQDIEWVVDAGGNVFIVQARPITVGRNDFEERRSVTWSNANINENYPGPVSPLLYSIASQAYTHYFRNLGIAIGVSTSRIRQMENVFRCVVGVHGAHLYYNLTSIHDLLRMAPYGERLVRYFNQFVGAEEEPVATTSAQTFIDGPRNRFLQACEFLRIAVKTSLRLTRLRPGIEHFERVVDEFARSTDTDALQRKSELELAVDLRRFMEIRLHHWVDASVADGASMLSYGLLWNLLDRWAPQSSGDGGYGAVLSGLDDLVSTEPVVALWQLSDRVRVNPDLARLFDATPAKEIRQRIIEGAEDPAFSAFLKALNRYLDHYGFRCSGELMLTTPDYRERPEDLLEIIKGALQQRDASPLVVLEQQRKERLRQTTRLLDGLKRQRASRWSPWPSRAVVMRRMLAWTQRSIGFRERARFRQSLLYSRLRGIVLAIGERLSARGVLADRDEIFYLTVDEIDSLLQGRSMFPASVGKLVALRASEHQRLGKLSLPDSFTIGEGRYLNSTGPDGARADSTPTFADSELTGVCACAGSVTASAAVLGSVKEAARLHHGDILVTQQTDPGWGPVFFLIKGLIIERGGMLSHGAILAREFGIPAIVGVKGATRRIRHGSKLALRAGEGIVSILD